MTIIVDLAYVLLLLVVGPFYWVKRLRAGKGIAPLRDRCGRFAEPPPATEGTIWIHAVSVGEVLAARGLIERIRAARPEARLVLTTTTVAGLEVARKTYPGVVVLPSPLDFSWIVRRFLRRLQPRVLALVELELWPNLMTACARRGVPVVVVNARVSERSLGRYRFLTRIWPAFLAPIHRFLAQGPEHAERLKSLGVAPDRIAVAGNLKFDNAEPQDPAALRKELRAVLGFGEADPVLVAGSTHPGEEEPLIRAMIRVRRSFPTARILLAPRHRERLDEVTALLSELQFPSGRRSDPSLRTDLPCVLLDTTGELARFYAVGDVAFVGGTWAPVGGHNLLEPAVFGVPILTGPHLKTVRDTASMFAEVGALVEVKDAEALASRVEEFFASPAAARERGGRARALIETRRGAAAQCAEVVLALSDGASSAGSG